jgi:hypothetical protein
MVRASLNEGGTPPGELGTGDIGSTVGASGLAVAAAGLPVTVTASPNPVELAEVTAGSLEGGGCVLEETARSTVAPQSGHRPEDA